MGDPSVPKTTDLRSAAQALVDAAKALLAGGHDWTGADPDFEALAVAVETAEGVLRRG